MTLEFAFPSLLKLSNVIIPIDELTPPVKIDPPPPLNKLCNCNKKGLRHS